MGDTLSVDLSPEEQLVVFAMRSDERAGQAIHNYSKAFVDGLDKESLETPWRSEY